MRTSQDTQRCTLDTVTRLAALIASLAAIPLLEAVYDAVVRKSDRKAATPEDEPYGGYPK